MFVVVGRSRVLADAGHGLGSEVEAPDVATCGVYRPLVYRPLATMRRVHITCVRRAKGYNEDQ